MHARTRYRLAVAFATISMASVAGLSSAQDLSPPPDAAAAGYTKLVFSDEFNGSDVSELLTRWDSQLWFQKPVTNDHYRLQDGYLRITSPSSGPTQGLLTTWSRDNSHAKELFHYGYFEARMRWPADGPGNHPAFWLESSEAVGQAVRGPQHPYCEIDVMEGWNLGIVASDVHSFNSLSNDTDFFKRAVRRDRIDTEQWHTYSVLWEPGKITFFIDHQKKNSINSPSTCNTQSAFIVINAGRRDNQAHTVDVDWVRAYQQGN